MSQTLPNVPGGQNHPQLRTVVVRADLGVSSQSNTVGSTAQGLLVFHVGVYPRGWGSAQESISGLGLELEVFLEVSGGQYDDLLVLASWAHDG